MMQLPCRPLEKSYPLTRGRAGRFRAPATAKMQTRHPECECSRDPGRSLGNRCRRNFVVATGESELDGSGRVTGEIETAEIRALVGRKDQAICCAADAGSSNRAGPIIDAEREAAWSK